MYSGSLLTTTDRETPCSPACSRSNDTRPSAYFSIHSCPVHFGHTVCPGNANGNNGRASVIDEVEIFRSQNDQRGRVRLIDVLRIQQETHILTLQFREAEV